MDGDCFVLDKWTQIALDSIWKELVEDTKEANNTGVTQYSDTGDTQYSDTGFNY